MKISWALVSSFMMMSCIQNIDKSSNGTVSNGDGNGNSSVDTGNFVPDEAGTLVLTELIEPHMAGIWNGMVPLDDEGFVFSTMTILNQGQPMMLTLRHYDWDLNSRDVDGQQYVPITRASEIPEGDHITDHAIFRIGDSLYFVYTANINKYMLHVVKTDLNGQRELFKVIYEEAPYPANDMLMVATDEHLCIRIGMDGPNKYAICLDPDTLDVAYETNIQTPSFTGNLGSALHVNGEFNVFAGGNNQRDITLTRFDEEWQPLEPFEQTIVQSENNEWNWAASGSTYIPEYDMWAVAYTNMPDGGQSDFDARGRLDLFDSNWNLVDRSSFGELGTHRPHLLWQNPYLFLSYDAGPVVIRRYELE